MRGVVFDGVGAVRVADLPDPDLEAPTDAIVRVTRSAICGSDLHLLHGKAPMEPGEPLGHEAVGVIEAVGDGVETRRVGDRVAVAFNVACGHCWFCGIGQSSLCDDDKIFGYGIFGGALPGAQAERLRVPDADLNLLEIPDGVGDEAAVFVGDVLTTGSYGASLTGAGPDDVVAVLGCGPVGFCTIEGLRTQGGPTIYALDRDPSRLALAETAGAIPVHIDERNPVTALAEATDGRGADVVIDAVGHPTAFEGAIDTVRRGGTVVVLGRLLVGDDGAPARGVLVASAHAPVRGAHARGVVVGQGDGGTGAWRGGPDAADQPSTSARGRGRGLRAVRPPGSHEGGPRAVTITVVGGEPSGLASMVADLIEQNLARDPTRTALLRRSVAVLDAPDADVTVFLRIERDGVRVGDGDVPDAHLRIRSDSGRLLDLTTAPLRGGLPDPLRPEGRAIVGDLLRRRIRIRGLLRHPLRLVRLTKLLSVADGDR